MPCAAFGTGDASERAAGSNGDDLCSAEAGLVCIPRGIPISPTFCAPRPACAPMRAYRTVKFSGGASNSVAVPRRTTKLITLALFAFSPVSRIADRSPV